MGTIGFMVRTIEPVQSSRKHKSTPFWRLSSLSAAAEPLVKDCFAAMLALAASCVLETHAKVKLANEPTH